MSPQIGQASELIFRDDYTACPVRPRGFVRVMAPVQQRKVTRARVYSATVPLSHGRMETGSGCIFHCHPCCRRQGPSVTSPPLAEQDGNQTDGTVSTDPV